MKKQKMTAALICGMLGCLCYGGGDWLMMYGDTAHDGSVYWLTRGRGTDSGMEEYACHGAGFSGNHLIRYCAALVLYLV
ncbi:hypothetical protein AALB47_13430 [Lachnospiraceae bacterium 54-11]